MQQIDLPILKKEKGRNLMYLNKTCVQLVVGMHPFPFWLTAMAEERTNDLERYVKSMETFVAKSVQPPPSVVISQYARYGLPVYPGCLIQ